jgi:nucleoside-diphosphate-sugar epimerase
MASLLIIGGSGFFGKSILDAYKRGLLAPWKVDHIDVIARSATNLAKSNPELMSENIFLHDLDITVCDQILTADYVIHAAASTDAKNYLSRPAEEKKNIQLGTLNFCRLAEKYLANSKILYVSSGAVYGQQPADLSCMSEEFSTQAIETLDKIKQDYAAAKRDGETYIQALGMKSFNVSIARCFAFVGSYLPRDQHFAIGNFIEDGLKGKVINVKAQHPVYRSYLYADDLVTWLMTIIEQSDPHCPIVNVGSDEAILMGDLAKMVADYFGLKTNIPQFTSQVTDRYVPAIEKALRMGCTMPMDIHGSLDATIRTLGSNNLNNE